MTDTALPSDAPDRPAPQHRYRWWLYLLAAALVAATLLLIGIGGLVTSMDAGMAVPDGFWTFGHWSLTAPLETWWDKGPEVRAEHTHRIKGYVVGMLTIGVFVGAWKTQKHRPWVRWLAAGLLVFVIFQGVLGILRVDEISTPLAMVHGITGQVFLCMTVLMAAAVGRMWIEADAANAPPPDRRYRRLRTLTLSLLLVYFVQLILGAAVRHTASAHAIPDFPLHYGSLLPPFTQTGLERAAGGATHLSLSQVWLHFAHRIWAYLLVIKTGFVAWRLLKVTDWADEVLAPIVMLVALLVIQVILGIAAVLMGDAVNPPPMVATLHQTFGAALIGCAAWLVIRVHLTGRRMHLPRAVADPPSAASPTPAPPAAAAGGVA